MQSRLTHGNESALTAHCHASSPLMSLYTHFHRPLFIEAPMQVRIHAYNVETVTYDQKAMRLLFVDM